MSDSENKIDKVVDEVLESKRLKQGVSFLFKFALVFIVIVIIGIVIAEFNNI